MRLPNILIANIRSLNGKSDELYAVTSINSVDIVCLTETWLNPSIPDLAVSLSNFVLHRNDRVASAGGGVCAFVKFNVKGRRMCEFENPEIESLIMDFYQT